jgi:hypothetical protein
MSFQRPGFIDEWLKIYRDGGLFHLLKVRGWTVVIAFFLFYLVRDSVLYILVPYLAYSNLSSCF